MLTWLWKRLSDSGAETTVSGRTLGQFSERSVERLLRARVLIETRKTDSWSVCPQCDCGLDVRPIRWVGDENRACCPHDAAEDVVLTEHDLKRFTVDGERLAGEVAASGGLVGIVVRIDDGLWLIGKVPAGHSVVLCSNRDRLEAPGMILAVKAAAGGTRVALIVPAINPAHAIRWREAGITLLDLGEVMIRDQSGTDRLVVERIRENPQVEGVFSDGVTSNVARLLISRSRRSVQLDGRDFVLSLTEFDCFLGAAEKVAAGLVMLTYRARAWILLLRLRRTDAASSFCLDMLFRRSPCLPNSWTCHALPSPFTNPSFWQRSRSCLPSSALLCGPGRPR